jgi:hypothetical protein
MRGEISQLIYDYFSELELELELGILRYFVDQGLPLLL